MKSKILSIAIFVMILTRPIITEKSDTPPPIAEKEANYTQVVTMINYAKEVPKTAYPCTQEDIYIMAHLLNGECGNVKNDEWVKYYGSVVLNRIDSTEFPNTLKEVVFQKHPLQYACTVDGNYDREPPQRMFDIAKELLTNGSIIPKNIVFQAQKRQGSGTWKKCGNNYFCYR